MWRTKSMARLLGRRAADNEAEATTAAFVAERDSRSALPNPDEPEFGRLRRIVLGPIAVRRMRRKVQFLEAERLTSLPPRPHPSVLAAMLQKHTRHLTNWP